MATKTWFITGASRGFGREWAIAALERGDRVAATVRELSAIDDLAARFGDALLPFRLDVTDRAAAVAAVQAAHDRFGRLDIVVNNAGYGHFGMVEEITEEEARAQLETNFFAPLWITQAALPFMRAQGSGHIVQVSSIGGVTAFMNVGIYHASKWALEAVSQSLALEVAQFGIRVTLVEPGAFDTDWSGPSSRSSAPNPVYDGARELRAQQRAAMYSAGPGDPAASAKALLAVVDAEEPPLRVFFGSTALGIARADYESRLATWERWDHIARLAQG